MRRFPLRRKTDGRWQTMVGDFAIEKFGGVQGFTVAISAGAKHPVTPSAVYKWIAGRHKPRTDYMNQITALSHGAITQHNILERARKKKP